MANVDDEFNPKALPIGCQVVIRAPNDVNVIGVVASVDEDARSVTFTDGRTHVFPEPAGEEPEVTP
jgi:hypothetical protein